ncbi:Protein CWH43 [Botrytis cinerea]
MAPKFKDGDTVLAFSGKWVSWTHTAVAYAAFLSALIVGVSLHYHKIVQNEYYGYPDEWFPSVSATIGDRYPERPRFALVGLWYLLTARPNSKLPKFVAFAGVFRCLALSPDNARAVKYRKYLAGSFFGTLVPLVYFFIQHKVHRVAGAYTTYAFFEWALILFDVAFDAVTALDFETFELVVKDVKGQSKGKEKEVGQLFGQSFSWPEAFDAAADVYNGFVFWSMLTSLGIVVWYFPLWHMGISGYEVMVMCTISPLFLGIRSIRALVVKNLRACHLMSLIGLCAYQITSPAPRLFVVGFGLWMSCLSWAATWYASAGQPGRLESKISAWTIGLIASSVVKFTFHTNNPIWPIAHAENGGLNGYGLIIAILAVLRSTRPSQSLITGDQLSVQSRKEGPSLLAGLGIGGLFFGLHSLLSDSSTMILWVWEGYPVRGPISAPHGAWTIAAMGVGLILGLFNESLARSWTLYGVGCDRLPEKVQPTRLELVSSYTTSWYYSMFGLWPMLFVPGGPLVREHTDWVMTVTMLLIGCGVFATFSSTPVAQRKRFNAFLNQRKQRLYYLYIIAVLQLASISTAYMRFPTYDYVPYHKDEKVFTAGIWTIHFSLDNDMWSSEHRMRDVIKELEIDVIGLLESDLQRIIMGNRDTTQFLAEDLGMYVDYGPGPNKHTWGCALLSKFPILNSTHHLLPSPVGELAPAIAATLDVYGSPVDVFVFHSGQEEDPEDRRLQSEYLADLMGASTNPSILLSYLVTKPLEGNYNTYVSERSGMHDIDPSDWDRWCEYILYKGLRRSAYARVSRSTITDTEIQVGKFLVGEPEGESDEVRNRRVDEEDVSEGKRFPQLFRGEGVRGHRYHVFDEPRYYG